MTRKQKLCGNVSGERVSSVCGSAIESMLDGLLDAAPAKDGGVYCRPCYDRLKDHPSGTES